MKNNKLFDEYKEYDENEVDHNEEATEQPATRKDIKELAKALKKIVKKHGMRNKKKIRKIKKKVDKIEKKSEEEMEKESEQIQKKDKKERPFLKRLGDVFLKALPKLLTVAVTASIKFLIGGSLGRKHNWGRGLA